MRFASQLLTHLMKTATCATRAGSFALCLALGCVTCLPAVADTATFSSGATMTVTLPDLANVTYSIVSNQPTATAISTGSASLVYGSQSFSWNAGILSYEFDPASGSAASPSGGSFIDQRYNTTLEIVNTNSYSVDISILSSLTHDGTATSSGVASSSFSDAILDIDSIPPYYSPLSYDISEQCLLESNQGSIATENCANYSSGVGGPTTIPVSMTSDFTLAANSVKDITVFADSTAEAYIGSNVPEPGTLVLLSTGAGLGFLGAVRRKLLLRP
jgi:hypothetical protein